MHAADPPADRSRAAAAAPGERRPRRGTRRLRTLIARSRRDRIDDSDELVLSLLLPGGAIAPARSRAALAALSRDVEPGQLSLLRLLVSELVSNSVVHGATGAAGEIRVRITISAQTVRCDVRDAGHGFEVPEPLEPRATGGLGLVIVDRASTRWGTRDGGRHVWFEMQRVQPPTLSRRR